MSDNPSIDPGTTPSIPVEGDDIGSGVIRQGVVIGWGAKDASVRVTAAAPLPVVQTGTPALPTGAATEATQTTQNTQIGGVTETAPTTDTASSGLNGRLQRIAQRLTSIIGVLPSALGANGGLKIEGVASGTTVPISGTVTTTPSGTQTVSGTVTANIGTSGSLALDATLTGGTQQAKITDGTRVATVKAASTAAGAVDTALVVAVSPNNSVAGTNAAASQVDGHSAAIGSTTDAAATTTGSVIAQLRRVANLLAGTLTVGLPSGAATSAKQPALGTAGTPSTDVISVQGVSSGTAIPVSGAVTFSGTMPTSSAAASQVDGHSATLGSTTDAAATTTGSVIAQLRRIANLVAGTLTVSGTVTTTPPSNASSNVAQINGVTPLMGNGTSGTGAQRVTLASDSTGQVALAAGAAAIGSVTTELATGITPFSNTALSNTKTAVKAGAGKVYGWMIHNPSAATTFIQVWNVAIGSITVGTTAPTYTITIPAGQSANVFTDRGITHSTEINIAATTTATGSTAPATAAVVSLFYI